MRFVPWQVGATLSLNLDDRPDAGATFTVYSPSGGVVQTATAATINAVDTTLAGVAAAGATTLTLASATGVIVGRSYLVGGHENTGGERVTVRGLAGTTATLVRPLRTARASGVAFQSTRVDLAVGAAACGTHARHYRAEVAWSAGGVAQPTVALPFDVVRYMPVSHLTLDEVASFDPIFAKRLAAGTWFPAIRDRAWDMICTRVAQKVDPGAVIGAVDLTTPHSYLVRALVLETAGEEWAAHRDDLRKRFQTELDAALAARPVDDDQDGAVERHEGWRAGLTIMRG